jgi:hypothetical protein
MPKITDKELESVLVRLFKEDLVVLRRLYKGSFGVNRAIRTIVHTFVTQTTAIANAEIDGTPAAAEAEGEAEGVEVGHISQDQLDFYKRQLDS